MADILSGFTAELSITALVSLVAMWLLRYVIKGILDGELVPRRHLDTAQNDAKEWKELALQSQATTQELTNQIDRLIDAVEGPRRVIESIPHSAKAVAKVAAEAISVVEETEGGK